MYKKHLSVKGFPLILFVLVFFPLYAWCQTDSTNFIKGADVSVLPQIEDGGGIYTLNEIEMDALDIFKEYDFNYIRLKLWHTPQADYDDLAHILEMALRLKEKGFKFLLNFHYSDTWADPGSQTKPLAWQGIPFADLVDSVYIYTKFVIARLDNQGSVPDMVQIGNEINSGMLWNDGRVGTGYDHWQNLADLLKAGIAGVRDGAANGDSIKIMIHRAGAADFGGNDWFFGNLSSYNIDFDIIGLSYYPWWHGTLSSMESAINSLAAKYAKDIIIAETAYPWTLQWYDNVNNIVGQENQLHNGYPATTTGQSNFLRTVMQIVSNVDNQRGKGLFYWEPEYISAPERGSPWENVALFDFDGEALPTFNVFRNDSQLQPVNATILVNTATNWDTLQPYHFVQLRGEVKGASFGILPDGKEVSWSTTSDLVMQNIGGDYWKIDFQIYPGDELSFKIWTGYNSSRGTYLRVGYEGVVTAFNGGISNTRNLLMGSIDTTVMVQYYNSSPENKPQYWQPFEHKKDSIAVFFRVNMGNALSSGRFNPESNGPLAVRGDSVLSAGMLSWEKSNIILEHEENSVNGGSFWSGTGYLPLSGITEGSMVSYKFFIENDTQNGWENNIASREFTITQSLLISRDTTLHWVYFDDNIVNSVSGDTPELPDEITLFQNYPNPFNPSTTIRYRLSTQQNVKIVVSNILGREIQSWDQGRTFAGDHSLQWDGKNSMGQQQGSGLYFIHLITANNRQTIKALIIR